MKAQLANSAISELSKHIDAKLAEQLLTEAEEQETAFALHKWKYTQLDGGRFCEVAARILYAADMGVVNLTKSVEGCINYIENDSVQHNYSDRQALQHIAKVIKAAYKLRSQRGAVHVTPKYTADELDSRLVIECCRWILADILRLFAGTSRNDVVELIQELAFRPTPLVRQYGDKKLLQSVKFTTEEEVLALLYFGPQEGMTMSDLIGSTPKDPSGVRRSARNLLTAKKRETVLVNDKVTITDLGISRVENAIRSKVTN